jgi:RNA polymerase sigma-70 factor (ECF subfamily)
MRVTIVFPFPVDGRARHRFSGSMRRLSGPGRVVVARYYRELLNFLSRTVDDRDAAADLVQESYARVLAVQQSGQTVAEPRALLYRTARNLVIDRYRRGAVRGESISLDDAAADAHPLVLRAPAASEPEASAESSQGVAALLAVIGGLPLRCREAFILHKFDGLSQAEVAQRMGISVTMVERHLKHAMQACRACRNGEQVGVDAAGASTSLRS